MTPKKISPVISSLVSFLNLLSHSSPLFSFEPFRSIFQATKRRLGRLVQPWNLLWFHRHHSHLGCSLGGRILDIVTKEKVIIPCFIVIIVSIIVLTFSTTLLMSILVAIVFGTGWGFLYLSLVVYAVENSGPARGPAMGTSTALADLGTGIGPMIVGMILEWTNYPIMFFSLTLIGVINFLYFRHRISRKKRLAAG